MWNKKRNKAVIKEMQKGMKRREESNRRLSFAAVSESKYLLDALRSSHNGLDEKAVIRSREEYGNNKVTHEKKKTLKKKIMGAFINPFTAILFCLAVVSAITDIIIPIAQNMQDDIAPLTVIIIVTMVMISGALRFVQETRSGNAADKLLAMITTTCCIERKENGEKEITLEEAVVGDIVRLSAGDMVPADVRIIEAKDLFISQSALTGESDPLEKTPNAVDKKYGSIMEYPNLAYMGSNVISGSSRALIIAVGDDTLFGTMASEIAGEPVETGFTKGVNAVSWVLIRFMMVMVPIVFFVNGITKGDWLEALLFGISIAVGSHSGNASDDCNNMSCQRYSSHV